MNKDLEKIILFGYIIKRLLNKSGSLGAKSIELIDFISNDIVEKKSNTEEDKIKIAINGNDLRNNYLKDNYSQTTVAGIKLSLLGSKILYQNNKKELFYNFDEVNRIIGVYINAK